MPFVTQNDQIIGLTLPLIIVLHSCCANVLVLLYKERMLFNLIPTFGFENISKLTNLLQQLAISYLLTISRVIAFPS